MRFFSSDMEQSDRSKFTKTVQVVGIYIILYLLSILQYTFICLVQCSINYL